MSDRPVVYWLTQSAGNVPAGAQWLTAGETAKLEQLRFLKRRADWRLGRWTAKRAVCAFFDLGGRALEPGDVEILAAADGAPEVRVGGQDAGPAISISHTRGTGFCAVTRAPNAVGCDVETVEERSERFIEDYFTQEEARLTLSVSGAERALAATLVWSAKESVLKALRTGLGSDTRSVDVRIALNAREHDWNEFSAASLEGGRAFHGWWRREGELAFTLSCESPTDPPSPLLKS